MDFLKKLTEEEREIILEAPALVTVLIGSADKDFDKDEEARAKRVVHFRKEQGDPLLYDYFIAVDKGFDKKVDYFAQKYQNNTDEIALKLAAVKAPLAKLDTRYAAALKDNLRSLATAVAQESGGFMGFLSISEEEGFYTKLEMLD